MMKIGVNQFASRLGDPASNVAEAERLIHTVAARGAGLALLPEMWNTGFLPRDLRVAEESRRGPAYLMMQRAAAESRIALVGGSILVRDAGRVFNRSFVFGRGPAAAPHPAAEVASYDKAHLFSPAGEDRLLAPGVRSGRFDLDGVPCGVLICYELRFPELARRLAFAGAKVLFVPAQWPAARLDTWRTLLRARAIENSLFVVACNGCDGPEGPASSEGPVAGHSAVIGPTGSVLWEAGESAESAVIEIDPAAADAARAAFPAFDEARRTYAPGRS